MCGWLELHCVNCKPALRLLQLQIVFKIWCISARARALSARIGTNSKPNKHSAEVADDYGHEHGSNINKPGAVDF